MPSENRHTPTNHTGGAAAREARRPSVYHGGTMLFDRICGHVERHVPPDFPLPLAQAVRHARVFRFEGPAHEVVRERGDLAAEAGEMFLLPYPSIAAEDDNSCVVLADLETPQHLGEWIDLLGAFKRGGLESTLDRRGIGKIARESKLGLRQLRLWIEVIEINEDSYRRSGTYHEDTPEHRENAKQAFDAWRERLDRMGEREADMLLAGVVACDVAPTRSSTDATRIVGGGTTCLIMVATKHCCVQRMSLFESDPGDQVALQRFNEATRGGIRNALWAMEEMALVQTPKHFILEQSPLAGWSPFTKRLNGAGIPRSHERPLYTLLQPKEIRRRMGLPEPTDDERRRAPRPHERRAHLRTLRAERFVHKAGKTVPVKASWIGPSEARVGAHVYRVLLDN